MDIDTLGNKFVSFLLHLLSPLTLSFLLHSNCLHLRALNSFCSSKFKKFSPTFINLVDIFIDVLSCFLCYCEACFSVENNKCGYSHYFEFFTQFSYPSIVPRKAHPGHSCVVALPLFLAVITRHQNDLKSANR